MIMRPKGSVIPKDLNVIGQRDLLHNRSDFMISVFSDSQNVKGQIDFSV
jgi:hypothetical protein